MPPPPPYCRELPPLLGVTFPHVPPPPRGATVGWEGLSAGPLRPTPFPLLQRKLKHAHTPHWVAVTSHAWAARSVEWKETGEKWKEAFQGTSRGRQGFDLGG